MTPRSIAKLSCGMVSRKMTEDIVFMLNGHFFRGFGRLIVDFFKGLGASSKFKRAIKSKKTNGKK
jgi:beta-glucosidase